jgi:benzil reductase ((S)-benzoin forming)
LNHNQKYFHFNLDICDTYKTEKTLSEIIKGINDEAYDKLCLVNNAAMVEPLKTIESCEIDEIAKNLQISLVAPIVLTSCFIKNTAAIRMKRKIVNISSGSGTYPAPDMSIYCTAKAGLNMFTRCVGREQAGNSNPIQIIAVDPGMVETEMQRIARTRPDFAMADYFNKAYAEGQLQTVKEVAYYLKAIIEKDIEPGKVINYIEH